MKDSITAKELALQDFNGISIAKPYGELLGEIALEGVGFVWGASYSGKSTLGLGIANALAAHGRVDFVPAEENFSITITKKINRIKAHAQNLHFTRWKGIPQLKKHLLNVKSKVVWIDSVSVLSANDSEVVKFAQWCRENKIGMWMIAHANKDGSYKGNSKIYHEADICIEVIPDDLAYSRKNRFDDLPRSIAVPFEVKGQPVKEDNSAFNSQMDEVEKMMKSA